jgi:predicted RNA-binding Zn-ribbon protein involved in translation (DUF1610 family)
MSDLGYQIRKGLDRVSFEADRLMRASRVRAEADRIARQIEKKTLELGERVLALAAEGKVVDPTLQPVIAEIRELNNRLQDKQVELQAINAEAWVPPPPPPPPPSPPPPPATSSPPPPSVRPAPPPPPSAPHEMQGDSGSDVRQGLEPGEVQVKCPNCGSVVRPVASHCPMCGFKISV